MLPLIILGGLLLSATVAITISYLTRKKAKEIIEEQLEYRDQDIATKKLSKIIKRKIFNPDQYNTYPLDFILKDKDEKIIAGEYFNGEVIKMEAIEADEIEENLERELEREPIVIL